ncbi:hypothetical protein Leryth_018746, partial [Lithospermum erythrorhizon]
KYKSAGLHFLCTITSNALFPIWPASCQTGPSWQLMVVSTSIWKLHTVSSRAGQPNRCSFNSTHKPGCETGDCGGGQLECNGTIGLHSSCGGILIQIDKSKPNFYDVSLVDGFDSPCFRNRNLQYKGKLWHAKVLAWLSILIPFVAWANLEPRVSKQVCVQRCLTCPSYFSYAYDSSNPLVACSSDDYIITFCPDAWGGEHMST